MMVLSRRSSLGDVLLALPVAAALRRAGHPVGMATSARFVPLLERSPVLSWVGTRVPGGVVNVVDLHHRRYRRTVLDVLLRGVHLATVSDRHHVLKDYAAAADIELSLPIAVSKELLDVPSRPSTARLVVGLGCSSRWATKSLPPELLSWCAFTISQSSRSRDVAIALIAGPGDLAVADAVRARIGSRLPIVESSAQRDLVGLASVLAGCHLYLGPDSGPTHLAQLLGLPTVVLFGPTSSARWGPWRANSCAVAPRMACSPCSGHGQRSCRFDHRACLTAVSLPDVKKAIATALEHVASH